MRPVADSLAALAALAAAPVVLAVIALRPAWREGFRERLGSVPGGSAAPVWIHGASVGEIQAAFPLIDALGAQGISVVASTMTVTGRDLLRRARPGVPRVLAPLDHPWCVARSLERIRPRALVFVETELWPSWLATAARRGTPAIVVSGRLSERSFARYGFVAPLARRSLRRLAAVGARTPLDAERFRALGVPAERVRVTGDLKLEVARAERPLAPDLARILAGVPLLVAGSTHEGEDEAALGALAAAEAAGLAAALVLAPRHLDRVDALARRVAAAGRRVRRRSAPGDVPLARGEVLLLDTLGELAAVYERAAVAFVGGSLVPRGGHNVLEPAAAGRPLLVGPHVSNVQALADLLVSGGAARQVADAEALGRAVVELLRDPAAAAAAGERGRRILAEHRGAVARTLTLLEEVIPGVLAGGARP